MQPILRVNLSTGEFTDYLIPDNWQRDYLGGASLAARLLYSTLTKGLEPFSPEAPLLFLNGPLSGTAGPATGRFVVCGLGAATKLWAESNIGGFWGVELRKAGFDGVWITGRSDRAVYIWIDEGKCELRDAARLWGKDVYDTQSLVKEGLQRKSVHVAVIGPAGERGVSYASICCDHGRMAGRTGLGAVMGAKKLKAIAVHGSRAVPVTDTERYAPLRSQANRFLKQDNEAKALHEIGTAAAADYSEYLGSMPVKYFSEAIFPSVDDISGSHMAETILTGQSACHACVIACGRVVQIGDGIKRKGPEYETICSFGPNLLIADLVDITLLGELCDRYGIDTISTGNTIGLAIHLFEMGKLTSEDTGGLSLRWGDARQVQALIHQIGNREGFGDILAEGSRELGRRFKSEEEAVQVNGLEVAYHDPRGGSGMGLVYATSPRGACHNQSDYFFVDWGHTEESVGVGFYERHAQAEKSANVARHQDWRTVYNSLVMCIFSNVSPQMLVDLVNAACGLGWTIPEMMKAGERAWNLKRAINHRLGLQRVNDKLPKALLQPYKSGGSAGYSVNLDEMLDAYYIARQWDPSTGKPTEKKLVDLGLADIAADLWS